MVCMVSSNWLSESNGLPRTALRKKNHSLE
jgi:hypothetical protein